MNEDKPAIPLRQPVWPEGAVGHYASLLDECGIAATERGVVPVFVPSLAATLLNAEQSRAVALTEAEAVAIRDRCPCIMLAPATAAAMEQERGYRDIDPDDCWSGFLQLKEQLNDTECA